MKIYRTFETERLLIRPTQTEDASFILELVNSPKWNEFIGERNIKTIIEAENYIISKMLPQLEKLGYSSNTIIRKEDNVKLGICGLFKREESESLEIGFALLPEFENMGYAFEANNELILFAKNILNAKFIIAYTDVKNYPSQKLIEKLGLHFVKSLVLPNETKEVFLYRTNF